MRAWLLSLCLLALAPATGSAQERPSKAVPTLARAPKLDGTLQDFTSPLTLQSSTSGDVSASFTARVGWRKDTLYVGVETTDDQLIAGELLTVSLFFPGAGPTASGHTFRFAFDGQRASDPESGTSPYAQEQVDAGVRRQGDMLTLEAAFPVRSFPRFPAQGPLILDLCITYEDQDAVGAKAVPTSNCQGGAMVSEALRLPDELRKNLKLKPPASVTALEPSPGGWLGWDALPQPAWVEARERLTPSSLRAMVAPNAVEPAQVDVNVPDTLALPDGRILLPVVSGKNPYAAEGRCNAEQELRLGLYLVERKAGKAAQRALDWPAATCALGRAISVALDEEGALTIGYSNGAITNFAWSGDHFERTEIGKR